MGSLPDGIKARQIRLEERMDYHSNRTNEAIAKMAESIKELTDVVRTTTSQFTRFEERQLHQIERMERLEENQREHGRKLEDFIKKDFEPLKKTVSDNAIVTKAAKFIIGAVLVAAISATVGMYITGGGNGDKSVETGG